jgi:hypothetical protein
MKRPAELTRSELVQIVKTLQGHLFLDQAGPQGEKSLPANAEYWNPDKSWEIDLLDRLGELLQEFGLAPDAVAPATLTKGTDSAGFSEADALEIYSQVQSKLSLVERGHYDSRYCGEADPSGAQRRWVEHLKAVLHKLGPDGRNLL